MLWQAVSIIGIIAALVLLSYLVMRGVNLLVVAVACSLLVAITGHIDLYDALAINYMSGFASFVQNNFLIFLAGALMGTVYEITQGAKSIARLIIRTLGKKQATLAVILSVGILTYGGIAGFVVCFAVFPIALEVYRAADIPRRFIPGTIIFGCCTFSSIGPGNPQVGQVVLMKALGTTLMDGAVIGFIATGLVLVIGTVWLNSMIGSAQKNGEHFVAKDIDKFEDNVEVPEAWRALLPRVLTLIAINIPVGDGSLIEVEYGVFLGAVLAYLLMRKYRTEHRPIMQYAGDAVKNAITSVCNTSSVVAFGSVVKAAIGFDAIISAMTNIPGPPLLAVAIATTVLAGVCGSGSGGLGIAAPILLELYGGVVPLPALHRTMLVASSGLDTLPHNGFVVTVLNGVSHETHKDGYMPILALTVVTPIAATVVTIVLFTLFPNLP